MSKILIIEDDAPFSHLLRVALTDAGHTVVTAGNGREGVAQLQQTRFDVVITDIVMPGMDGNQVADYIRRSTGAVPTVIGMSGTIDLVSRSKFDVVFKKPFAIKTFLSTVAAHTLPANLSAKTGRA